MIHQHQSRDEGQAALGELDRISFRKKKEKKKPVNLSAYRIMYCFMFERAVSIAAVNTGFNSVAFTY